MERAHRDIGEGVVRLSALCRRADKLIAQSTGLKAEEVHCLVALYLDAPHCVKNLCHILNLSASRTSRVLRSLEHLGLVVRAVHPSDHRMGTLTLTGTGTRTAEHVLEVADDVGRQILGSIPRQVESLFSRFIAISD
jgi:DNA-binding MarR family transcriptional regulator